MQGLGIVPLLSFRITQLYPHPELTWAAAVKHVPFLQKMSQPLSHSGSKVQSAFVKKVAHDKEKYHAYLKKALQYERGRFSEAHAKNPEIQYYCPAKCARTALCTGDFAYAQAYTF